MLKQLVLLHFILTFIFSFGQSDTLNQTDENGFRQGYWIIYGHMKLEKGYCDSCKIEEGPYIDDRKNGVWTKYWKSTGTPRLIGTYVNNRPVGEYWKYSEKGCLIYHGAFDGHTRKEPSSRYLDDCDSSVTTIGTKIQEENQSTENLNEGTQSVTGIYPENNDIFFNVKGDSAEETIKPNFEKGFRKDGKKKDPNGYNKLYNSIDELYLDGNFKNNQFWEGKYYIYDSDGILLKIEIWKDGKYHSDGQLN